MKGYFKELKLLKEILKETLGSDEFEDVCWYLDDWKRLKKKELKKVGE